MLLKLRQIFGLSFMLFLAGCTILPRSGPTTQDVYKSTNEIPIVPINLGIVSITNLVTPYTWIKSSPLSDSHYDILGVGDTIKISVWEHADEGLYSGDKKGVSHLDSSLIDASGALFVPYVGRVRAAGLSTYALQKKLRHVLKNKMLNPQVVVSKVEILSQQITIQGIVAKPGTYVLKPGNHDLISLLGESGGATLSPELTEIMLTRRGKYYQTTLLDLFKKQKYNISLHPHDHIMVSEINRSFSVLGATGRQQLIKFPKNELRLIEALALAQGLDDDLANPSHVFLLRTEARDIISRFAPNNRLQNGHSQIIYELNMRKLACVFAAQQFKVRDKDVILATNAPYTNVRKILSSLSPAIALGRTAY